jgi:hypothetical protein
LQTNYCAVSAIISRGKCCDKTVWCDCTVGCSAERQYKSEMESEIVNGRQT